MNRRRDAWLCLIAAPIVYLLSQALWPPGSNEGDVNQLAAVAAHPTAFAVATICEAGTWILLAVRAIGWSTRLDHRDRRWGFSAIVAVFVGMIAFTGAAAVNLTVPALARDGDPSAASIKDSWALDTVIVVIIVMLYIGELGQHRGEESVTFLGSETVLAAGQQPAGPVQRVLRLAAAPRRVPLGGAPHLIHAGQVHFHNMKRIQGPDGFGRLCGQRGGVAAERTQQGGLVEPNRGDAFEAIRVLHQRVPPLFDLTLDRVPGNPEPPRATRATSRSCQLTWTTAHLLAPARQDGPRRDRRMKLGGRVVREEVRQPYTRSGSNPVRLP